MEYKLDNSKAMTLPYNYTGSITLIIRLNIKNLHCLSLTLKNLYDIYSLLHKGFPNVLLSSTTVKYNVLALKYQRSNNLNLTIVQPKKFSQLLAKALSKHFISKH